MEYKRFGDTYLVRLEKGEEILTSLTRLAEKEDIHLASVSGLGAINSFTAGVFFRGILSRRKSVPQKRLPRQFRDNFSYGYDNANGRQALSPPSPFRGQRVR